MKEHFPDLSFELQSDGLILIEQYQNHEPVRVDIHLQQLAHMGRVLFNGKGTADKRIREQNRRLSVLRERIEVFVKDPYHRQEIIERCGEGMAMLAQLDALLDLAYEFDGGITPIPSEELKEIMETPPSTALVPVAGRQDPQGA